MSWSAVGEETTLAVRRPETIGLGRSRLKLDTNGGVRVECIVP
jgi:hypothetical protein